MTPQKPTREIIAAGRSSRRQTTPPGIHRAVADDGREAWFAIGKHGDFVAARSRNELGPLISRWLR